MNAVQLRWDTWSEMCDFAGVGPKPNQPSGVLVGEEGRIGLLLPRQTPVVAIEGQWIVKNDETGNLIILDEMPTE